MNYILVIWTVVAMNGGGASSSKEIKMDWRPIGDFSHVESCKEAARLMNIHEANFRCLPKYRS